MRKETINTFSDGMSLDLNPLGTPAKTLTNCLNGTLITYNGNELTLQNDMGNVPVGTAALPKGYVPVGMKEHGGIIYVASYNPETKKGLLGCFPSPQQIYTSEAALTVLNINILKEFINLLNGYPFIKINEYKEEIFKDSLTQEAKIFNSGDLFIIKSDDNFSELLRLAIDENIIVLKLLIIPTSGGEVIDISDCENNDLKLYSEDNEHKPLWIFLNGGGIYNDINEPLSFDTIINEHQEYLQSYPRNIGPGILQLVIEFNTFKVFNLYNEISKEKDGYNVLFIGVAEPYDLDTCHIVNKESISPLSLFGSINFTGHTNIDKFEELTGESNKLTVKTGKLKIFINQKLFYDILPACKWGISDNSFLKSGEISFSDIVNFGYKIRHWSFEINDNEALIKWSFLKINSGRTIDHFRFVFIPFDLILDSDGNGLSKDTIDYMIVNGNTTEPSKYVYKITKPYFSGDFEDSFPIDDAHLSKNYIYLCRLDIIYTNGTFENAKDYKLLYTGTFFNDKDISQFNYKNRPKVLIEVQSNVEYTQDLENTNYTTIKEEGSSIVELNQDEVAANDIMFLADEKLNNKLIGTIANSDYNVQSTLSVTLGNTAVYNNKNYRISKNFAGNLEETLFLDSLGSNNKIKFNINSSTNYRYNQVGDDAIEKCKQLYIEVEEINNHKLDSNSTITFTKDISGKYTNTSKIKVHRGILSRLSLPEEKPVTHQGLYPVYEEDDTEYNSQMFGFTLDDDDFVYDCLYVKSVDSYYRSFINHHEHSLCITKNTTVQGNKRILNEGGPDTCNFTQFLKDTGNKPIYLCVTDDDWQIYDDLRDFETNLEHQLTMPHEISFSENTNPKNGMVWSNDKFSPTSKSFKENNLGYSNWNNSQAFFRPLHTYNCMTMLWRTQYGHRLVNVATPLNIAEEPLTGKVMTLSRNGLNKFKVNVGKEHSYANMHIRTEKLLFCMLSLILIAKCKNSTLKLNVPNTLYQTETFNNEFNLYLNSEQDTSLSLNGVSIEKALEVIISNKVLNQEDAFLPKFTAKVSSQKINIGNSLNFNLIRLYEGAEYPYFSTLSKDLLFNIYPGIILDVKKLYLCNLKKDDHGLYVINNDLLDGDGKFYSIFLPTVIEDMNVPNREFSCTNTNTYKYILEGFAYNDILLPFTKIMKLKGEDITQLRSLDSENPNYNLLYYNALPSQEKNFGAVTLFGDLSAVINTLNFSSLEKPNTDLWKDVELFEQEDNEEETEESESNE